MSGRAVRFLQYGLLTAAAVLVAVFFFQTRLQDLDRHSLESQNLLRLKHLDTQLEDEAFKAITLQLAHFDAIVDTVGQIRTLLHDLQNEGNGGVSLAGPKVAADIATLAELMTAKIDYLETLKSRVAIVRNTLNFLPLEVERITQDGHDPVDVRISRMLILLMSQNVNPSAHNLTELEDVLAELEALQATAANARDLQRVLTHARANLKANDDIATLMKAFVGLPTRTTLDRVFDAHAAFVIERIKTANAFRVVLLALSLTLFAGLGLALFRLDTARAASERASRQFRDAVESVSEGFAFFDANGRLQFWNKTFARLHTGCCGNLRAGMTFDEFQATCVECGIYDAIFPDNSEERTAASGAIFQVRRRDGGWMLAGDSPMADGGTACVRVDITQAKRAEESLRNLSRAVEQSPASVIITDTDGVITYVNPKFTESTGYTAQEAIGQRPSMVSSRERPDSDYKEMWETIRGGREWRGEFHNKRKDGTLFWEYASISPVKDENGAITHFLAVKEDITERKNTMAELVRAKERAETASHAKSQFLANMSHELRTPLNAIIGFSEILKTQMFGPLGNANYVDYSGNIYDSGKHLLEVINDILDISRVETGAMEIHEGTVDLLPLAAACVEMLAPRAKRGKLLLSFTPPAALPKVRGDEIRLKQIMLNLLTNAVKFTPEGGQVELMLTLSDANEVGFAVRDTGYGIPKEMHQKILEPFEQVGDIYTRSHEGSGLGLYLVDAFVKLHQGTLAIDSEVDQGTTVTVTLPARRTLTA